jgi:hypothetical protein
LFEKHDWDQPSLAPDAQARLKTNDPQAIFRFNAKVAAAARAAAATSSLTFATAADWDEQRFAPSSDLVVLEVTAAVPTESWVRIEIDPTVPAIEGRSLPDTLQSRRIAAERTFFADGFRCTAECDPRPVEPHRASQEHRGRTHPESADRQRHHRPEAATHGDAGEGAQA